MNSADNIIINKRKLGSVGDSLASRAALTLSERAIALVLDNAFDRIRALEDKLSRMDAE